jgi:antitoxin ParD1/3/4
MPTRNVSLTTRLDEIIEQAVGSGEYENASEVVRAALRLFEAQQRLDAAKLEALRRSLDEGDRSGVFKGDATASVRQELGLPKRRKRG